MEAIFPVCGAGGPQLKRNPLGRGRLECPIMTPIDIILCSDPTRAEAFVELRTGGFVWAEVFYEPMREAYVARFFESAPSGLELPAVRKALREAQQLLVARGGPVLPE